MPAQPETVAVCNDAQHGRRTCLYRQKHTIASTSPTMSSLLSTLKALGLHLRPADVVRHLSPDVFRPRNGLDVGP